jgi:hypothetical protein
MKITKLFSVLLAALMLLSVFPLSVGAYSKEQATLTFADDSVTETVSGSSYTIDGTSLTITSDGTYRITGDCAEGKVEVSKNLSNVTLILDNLTLANSDTAPIIVKKSSSVLMKLVGTSTITNNEEASKETSDPDNFEGAAVKVKSGSALTIFGDGTLNAVGNAKNAIKGGAESVLTIDGGEVKATAVNNGIAFDGGIVINSGTFDVVSGNDGIKSEPDEGDTASAGTVTINGGTFNINAQGDGIVGAEKLTINNGDFTIKTLNGYNSSSFNKDTMSCKGLKASGNNNNETAPTNELVINGGTFNLNTADDAIHSDGYCDITGGTFYIYTGDDGVHADATLTLGTENGYDRDPEIYIYSSYEGLEGAIVNAYSGKYYVKASDDGINAAGGSSNGTQGQQGNDQFRPGGNRPGQGGNQAGQSNSNYSLNFYGGSFYVDCEGDGLDANGSLNLMGGDITVLSMRGSGDNSPIDADGTVTINGATIFAAGSRGMGVNLSGSSQKTYTSSSSYNAGTVINITGSGSTLRSEKLVRNINYLLYSTPDLGSCSVTTSSSVDSCKSNAFAHNWDKGTAKNGVIEYTCSDCNAVERKSIAKAADVTEYTEDDTVITPTENTTVYTVTFNTDEHASIEVYYTQDYTQANESGVTTTIARNSDTGESDGSGEGQVNFAVVTADGYEVDTVTVEGSYKNLKTPDDLGTDNIYRITKVSGDLKIIVKAKEKTYEETSATTEPTTEAVTQEPSETTATEATETTTPEPSETTATEATEATTPEPTATSATDAPSSATPATETVTNAISTQPTTEKTTTAVTKTKKSNTITAKAKTKKVNAKKTKKSTVKIKKAIKVSKAQGKVTYTKLSGSKKLKINKKTGTITVKKGTKKGTYKIKVKVTAKGNSTYKAGSKTVIVRIKVK